MNSPLHAAVLLAVVWSSGVSAQPLSTAFAYQGELLVSGAPAAGRHDLRFRLFDAVSGGAQVGPTLCVDNASVTDGRFTVELDFGAQFTGRRRFLEIEVRPDSGLDCGNPAGFIPVSPRQELTAAPHAVYSLEAASAADAAQLNRQPAAFYQNAANLTAGILPDARLAAAIARTNIAQTFTGAMSFVHAGNSFTGVGSGLVGLNASGISAGTLPDARLSANIATLGTPQTFSAAKTFSAAPAFTAAGAPFTVDGSTLVTNLNADLLDGLHASAFLQAVPNPLVLSGSSTDAVIKATNSSTTVQSAGVSGVSIAASGATAGGYFSNASTEGRGLFAYAYAGTGATIAGEFWSNSTAGTAVSGWSFGPAGTTYGGWFRAESTSGRAVYARANAASGQTYGGFFESASPDGRAVYGLAGALGGLNWGGYFESASTNGRGVQAMATAATGATFGGRFESASTAGRGVQGMATATTGPAYGGRFEAFSSSGAGVWGQAYSASGYTYGVFGQADSTLGVGVMGIASNVIGTTYGGYFRNTSPAGAGVYGVAYSSSGSTYGVLGSSLSAAGYGVYAFGDLGASGFKSFRIDHPLDPENRYLLHYATESPEVLNAYSGTAALNDAGEAVVELPRYFACINKDPRYTLTAVGAPMPMLHIAEEIDHAALRRGERAEPGEQAPLCAFRIAGGAPGARVSWRVEAVRNDRWMRLKGAPVETEKTGAELGTYQHPQLFGMPPERGLGNARNASAQRAGEAE